MIWKSIYILKVYSLHYTLTKAQILKTFLRTKWTLLKRYSFFFRDLHLIRVLFLFSILKRPEGQGSSLWKHVWDFPVFQFCSTKRENYLNLKHHNSFQDKNNRKTTHSFASRTLIFKFQLHIWKFNVIWVSWSSLKTDPETNFF